MIIEFSKKRPCLNSTESCIFSGTIQLSSVVFGEGSAPQLLSGGPPKGGEGGAELSFPGEFRRAS